MVIEQSCIAFLPNLGGPELVVIAVIALILFGRRLPEVGRSLGKGIVEFKKGLKDTGDEISHLDEERPGPRRGANRERKDEDDADKSGPPQDYKLT